MTGKFKRGHTFEEGDNRSGNKLFSGENYERAQNALDKLRPLADKYGVSVGELSLAWLIAQPPDQRDCRRKKCRAGDAERRRRGRRH